MNQNQAMTASIGGTRELMLVLHDEIEGLGQALRIVSVGEAGPTLIRRGNPCLVIEHQILVTSGSDRPDAQMIQGCSRFAQIFNAYRAWVSPFEFFPSEDYRIPKGFIHSYLVPSVGCVRHRFCLVFLLAGTQHRCARNLGNA